MLYIIILLLIILLVYNRVNLLNKLVTQRTQQLNSKLTENEELYSKLLEHEKYKNNYFINLSHELRTPLNIINTVQAVIKNLCTNQPNLESRQISTYMNSIKTNSDRLLNLINNIINTSKIESGHYTLNKSKVNFINLVENTALSMKYLAEENELELIIDPEVEEKIVNCDPDEIEKIIINLISNAIKFTKPGGKIEVFIYDLNNKIKLIVKDTGIGIDPKHHKSIFDRFEQAYESSTEENGGSGLGLTLTKQLIELHGGSISVKSNIGEGSEFIIILPLD